MLDDKVERCPKWTVEKFDARLNASIDYENVYTSRLWRGAYSKPVRAAAGS